MSEDQSTQIGVFAFGKILSDVAGSQFNSDNIKVSTFHSWAHKAYVAVFKKQPTYASNWEVKAAFKKAFNEGEKLFPKHRFFANPKLKEFVEEEINWIKGCAFESEKQYLAATRKGRGGKIRLSQKDRTLVYSIYTSYEIAKNNKIDFYDLAKILYKHIDEIPSKVKFDYTYIDEAQDLSLAALSLLVATGMKGCYIGADIGQKIYPTSFTWKDVGLDLRGNRVKTLNQSFRSTKQIVKLAQSLQKHDEISKEEEFTEHVLPQKEGTMPEILVFSDINNQDRMIKQATSKIIEEIPMASIGILCRNKLTIKRLACKIHGEILDPKNKKGTNASAPGVKFTTLHTSKGLEFDFVIIPDLVNPNAESILGEEFDWNLERRLLYVAMTRAKKHLQIFTTDENAKLIAELDKSLYNKINY